ncbi:LysR family transcriptional regulator [Akkermansia sp. EB-AMDK43]|uniref:LysR family transcriptional regulator n=1 Tax=Akkermansia sp. EB-AMDK43 TaxID=3073964 RepID=UPI0028684886|nr:LysR family transcriptional regulator [Akkermansia sp. EB-AMDK43]WMX39268.1 LysR family transcriptional regulator [Akkermansia sp. EB-AMDK43]
MFEHLFAERGLSLDRLKTLIEVAKAGSIAAAARGDSARQSLYSRQIKELEEFFGVELAARRGKVLALTRSGWELVRLASESLCLLDDFKSRSRNLPYRFTIGAGDSLHAWVVAPVLADIQQRGLPWLFALENIRNSEIPLKLQNMDVDFGIVRTSALAAEGLESRAICSMDYALYVPAALAGKKGAGKGGGFFTPAGHVPPGYAGERFRLPCLAETELRGIRHQAAGAV